MSAGKYEQSVLEYVDTIILAAAKATAKLAAELAEFHYVTSPEAVNPFCPDCQHVAFIAYNMRMDELTREPKVVRIH